MFANCVRIVFLCKVAPLGGDQADVGPRADGAFDPRGEGARLRMDVQLGDHCVLPQPLVVIRYHFIHILNASSEVIIMGLFQKHNIHNIRRDVDVQYMRFLNSGGCRNSQTRAERQSI